MDLFKDITEKQKNNSIKLSVLITVIFLLIYFLLSDEFIQGIALSLIVFILSLIGINYFFKRKKQKFIELIESQFPFMLLPLSSELNAGNEFEKALINSSKNTGKELRKEINLMLNEIEKGKSINQALIEFSKKNNSLQIKKITSILSNVYSQGKKTGTPIKRIAKEMLLKQKNKSKEFSQKIVLFSLIFIAVSAIIPAFFQAFITVGSLFMKIDFTPIQVIAITVILFPLLDLIILFLIKENTPMHLK